MSICQPGCVCIMLCAPCALGPRKRVLEPLELYLQLAIGCHVGAENQIYISPLYKSSRCSQLLSHCSSPWNEILAITGLAG